MNLSIHFTAWTVAKTVFSTVVSILGFYLLGSGKKNQEPEKMLWGAALIFLSFLAW